MGGIDRLNNSVLAVMQARPNLGVASRSHCYARQGRPSRRATHLRTALLRWQAWWRRDQQTLASHSPSGREAPIERLCWPVRRGFLFETLHCTQLHGAGLPAILGTRAVRHSARDRPDVPAREPHHQSSATTGRRLLSITSVCKGQECIVLKNATKPRHHRRVRGPCDPLRITFLGRSG